MTIRVHRSATLHLLDGRETKEASSAMGEVVDDEEAVRSLILHHFRGMKWDSETKPDWDDFTSDFHPAAILVPAARPASPKSVEQFVDRMNGVAEAILDSFEEWTLGMRVLRFGNVAVVLAASEMLENQEETNYDISGYLLIKDAGRWQILAHAWDKASDDAPVPEELR
ncbi:MAG: nuclear transport factor 2 family protein [bacterium]